MMCQKNSSNLQVTYRKDHIVCTVQASQKKDSSRLGGVLLPLQYLASDPVSQGRHKVRLIMTKRGYSAKETLQPSRGAPLAGLADVAFLGQLEEEAHRVSERLAALQKLCLIGVISFSEYGARVLRRGSERHAILLGVVVLARLQNIVDLGWKIRNPGTSRMNQDVRGVLENALDVIAVGQVNRLTWPLRIGLCELKVEVGHLAAGVLLGLLQRGSLNTEFLVVTLRFGKFRKLLTSVEWVEEPDGVCVLNLLVGSDALESLVTLHLEEVSEVVERADLPLASLHDAENLDGSEAARDIERTEVGCERVSICLLALTLLAETLFDTSKDSLAQSVCEVIEVFILVIVIVNSS
ncbi:hypothetical protein HG531_010589 [Fusarium graminearum]|nr:hypothetical protein HG531_010589 [Fusarium graminearum]